MKANEDFSLAILVHGFNVHDRGRGSVGRLRPFFACRGIPYLLFDYGWFELVQVYTKNKKVAKRLAESVKSARLANPDKKVIVVGHSNGCAIIHLACELYGAKIDKAVYINPALNKTTARAESMLALDVWYSPSDKPVKWAKLLPCSIWGEMGRTGYRGAFDPKTMSFDKENDFPVSSSSHSDAFALEELPYFGSSTVKIAVSGRS